MLIAATLALVLAAGPGALDQARTLAGQGRIAEALPFAQQAARESPDEARAHGLLGGLLNRLERYADAARAHDRAVALDPRSPALRYNRALTLAELGRFEAAIADFDLALDGRRAAPLADRASAKASLGDFTGARADLAEATRVESDYIWTRFYLAGLDYADGDFPAAADGYEAVAARQPEFQPAVIWRHLALSRAGRTPPPLPTADLKTWPGPVIAFLRGEIDAEALQAAAERLGLPEDDRRLAAARVFIGQQAMIEGRVADAAAAYWQALATRAPKHGELIVAERELRRLEPDMQTPAG